MKLPRLPGKKGEDVKVWAREVTEYLRSLTITSIIGGKVSRRPGGTTLIVGQNELDLKPEPDPWRVTANGDDSVTVGFGRILTAGRGTSPSESYGFPIVEAYIDHAEESVTITASGTLYIVCQVTEVEIMNRTTGTGGAYYDLRMLVPDPTGITVELNPSTTTGDNILVPIAEVSLTDGIATVDDQILTHNPKPVYYDYNIEDTP